MFCIRFGSVTGHSERIHMWSCTGIGRVQRWLVQLPLAWTDPTNSYRSGRGWGRVTRGGRSFSICPLS